MTHSTIRHRFKRSQTFPCHSSKVHSVRWSPDGLRIASCGQDRTMRLHRITESYVIQQDLTFKGHSDEIDQLCWSPINHNLVATASLDKTVKIWDVRTYDPCATIRLKNDNMSICWSPDASTIAVSDKADVLTFLDVASTRVIKDQAFKFEIGEITWNRESDLFFLTSADGKIHVLGYPDLQTVVVIDAFNTACLCIQFDATGKYFAVGSNDALTSIWDSENLACIQTITRPDWPVRAVSFSHDSRYIASGSEDSFIDIADLQTGEQVATISASAPTMTLDFHPKDHILAYALDDSHRDEGSIKITGLPQ